MDDLIREKLSKACARFDYAYYESENQGETWISACPETEYVTLPDGSFKKLIVYQARARDQRALAEMRLHVLLQIVTTVPL